jgi:hypothetical protein
MLRNSVVVKEDEEISTETQNPKARVSLTRSIVVFETDGQGYNALLDSHIAILKTVRSFILDNDPLYDISKLPNVNDYRPSN